MGYKFFDGFFMINKYAKIICIYVYTFCKSLCVINMVSPYGLHGVPIYILYLYDQMWLVGELFNRGPNTVIAFSCRDCDGFLFVGY